VRDLDFWIFVLGCLGVVLLVRYIRTGSLEGAVLGGRVRETVGEIYLNLSRRPLMLRVQILEPLKSGQPTIALTINRQGDWARFRIVHLDRDRALEVAELLGRAARSAEVSIPGA